MMSGNESSKSIIGVSDMVPRAFFTVELRNPNTSRSSCSLTSTFVGLTLTSMAAGSISMAMK